MFERDGLSRTIGSESWSVLPGGQVEHVLPDGSKFPHIDAQAPQPAQLSSSNRIVLFDDGGCPGCVLSPMMSAAAHLPAPAL